MSIRGTASGPIYLNNTAPVALSRPSFINVIYPLDVATADQSIAFYGRVSPSIDGWQFLNNSGALKFRIWEAGSIVVSFEIASFFTANAWHLFVARDIASTNHRLSGIKPTGEISHAADTTAASGAAGATQIDYGALDAICDALAYFEGDVQPSSGATEDGLLRRLWDHGPLGIKHIAEKIAVRGEHRTFRSKFIGVEPTEAVWGAHAAPIWQPQGALLLGPECPITLSWVQPYDDCNIIPLYVPDEIVPTGFVGASLLKSHKIERRSLVA